MSDNLDINGSDLLIDTIERALVHVLHANTDVWIRQERAKERDDIWGVAVMHDVQLTQNLFAHRWFGINKDDLGVIKDTKSVDSNKGVLVVYLLRHDGLGGDMFDLFDTPTIALSKFLKVLEVFVPKVKTRLRIHVQVCERV